VNYLKLLSRQQLIQQEKVDDFTVSNKYLGDANGGWSKFSRK